MSMITIEERRIKYQMTVVPIPSFLEKAISRDSRVIHGREGSIWLQQIMYQHSRPIEKIETFDKLLKSKNL